MAKDGKNCLFLAAKWWPGMYYAAHG